MLETGDYFLFWWFINYLPLPELALHTSVLSAPQKTFKKSLDHWNNSKRKNCSTQTLPGVYAGRHKHTHTLSPHPSCESSSCLFQSDAIRNRVQNKNHFSVLNPPCTIRLAPGNSLILPHFQNNFRRLLLWLFKNSQYFLKPPFIQGL